ENFTAAITMCALTALFAASAANFDAAMIHCGTCFAGGRRTKFNDSQNRLRRLPHHIVLSAPRPSNGRQRRACYWFGVFAAEIPISGRTYTARVRLGRTSNLLARWWCLASWIE